MMTNRRASVLSTLTVGVLWALWTAFLLFSGGSRADVLMPVCLPALAVLMIKRGNVHVLEGPDLWLTLIPGLLIWLAMFFLLFKATTKRMR